MFYSLLPLLRMLRFSQFGRGVYEMVNKLVSIIIPLYNAENTIARCIISIQQQTYEDIELIIINDGSTDERAQQVNNKHVSIIIPMYNAENTIARCITSIQQQTYEEIEIIIINDGSTDESAQIVQNKAKQDKRIHCFTQKNQGVSEARNKGVEYATGTFIQFVDADDWIHKTMTAQLIAKMDTETDLTICGYQAAQKNIRPQQVNHYEAKTLRQHIG